MYGVVAAAALALAWQLWRRDERTRELGPLMTALGLKPVKPFIPIKPIFVPKPKPNWVINVHRPRYWYPAPVVVGGPTYIGQDSWFQVIDNGEGSSAPPDITTLLGMSDVPGTAQGRASVSGSRL